MYHLKYQVEVIDVTQYIFASGVWQFSQVLIYVGLVPSGVNTLDSVFSVTNSNCLAQYSLETPV